MRDGGWWGGVKGKRETNRKKETDKQSDRVSVHTCHVWYQMIISISVNSILKEKNKSGIPLLT